MKQSNSKNATRRARKAPKNRSTFGRDDMVSNDSRKDYFVSNALEITPHPNQTLKAVLGQPVMDRRFKYSILETSLSAGGATSSTPISMINVSQGTTDITRTGDRIRSRRLWMSGKIFGNAAQTAPVTARLLVVVWNPVGVGASNAPVASQIVQFSAGYGPYGSYSRDYGDSFQVLYDAVFSVGQLTAAGEAEVFHFDRKILIDSEFSAGATTPTTNNIYVFFLSDVLANQPVLAWSSTLWYEDLDA